MTALTPTLAGPTARLAIACAIGGALSFSLNDMVIKLLSGAYPLHQIILVRSSVALVLTVLFLAPLEGARAEFRTRRLGLHLARGACVVTANMFFFGAIAAMPLAEATAVFFVSPFLIAGLSVLILGEVVGPRRWAAIMVGAAGVLIVVRPGAASFQVAAILPIIAAFGYAMLHVLTRRMRLTERASTMAIYTHVTFILVSMVSGLVTGGGAFATDAHPSLTFLFAPWVWPPLDDLAIMVGLGGVSAVGGYLITQAYRMGEAGLIAPFEYLSLALALFWGWTIWDELPDALAAVGIALIIGSGIYLALREAMAGRKPSVRRASARR